MPRRRNGDGLYKRPDGTYHYDVGKGVDRITIATGKHDRRAARAIVKQELAQRKIALSRGPDRNTVQISPMTGKTYLLGGVWSNGLKNIGPRTKTIGISGTVVAVHGDWSMNLGLISPSA